MAIALFFGEFARSYFLSSIFGVLRAAEEDMKENHWRACRHGKQAGKQELPLAKLDSDVLAVRASKLATDSTL